MIYFIVVETIFWVHGSCVGRKQKKVSRAAPYIFFGQFGKRDKRYFDNVQISAFSIHRLEILFLFSLLSWSNFLYNLWAWSFVFMF